MEKFWNVHECHFFWFCCNSNLGINVSDNGHLWTSLSAYSSFFLTSGGHQWSCGIKTTTQTQKSTNSKCPFVYVVMPHFKLYLAWKNIKFLCLFKLNAASVSPYPETQNRYCFMKHWSYNVLYILNFWPKREAITGYFSVACLRASCMLLRIDDNKFLAW